MYVSLQSSPKGASVRVNLSMPHEHFRAKTFPKMFALSPPIESKEVHACTPILYAVVFEAIFFQKASCCNSRARSFSRSLSRACSFVVLVATFRGPPPRCRTLDWCGHLALGAYDLQGGDYGVVNGRE
jgi:hypothetical protein